MPDIRFAVETAAPVAHAAVPTLAFTLRLTETGGAIVDTVALQSQIQIEVARRRYSDREQEALLDLFGEPARWGRTLRTMLWTHATTIVPRFDGTTTVAVPVPCPADLGVAAGKYFYALEDGDVPLNFQFSGTVFHLDGAGDLRVAPIPWDREAQYRLPMSAWREAVREHHSGSAWLRLPDETFDRLYRHRARRGLPTWEAVFADLLGDGPVPRVPGIERRDAPGADAPPANGAPAVAVDLGAERSASWDGR